MLKEAVNIVAFTALCTQCVTEYLGLKHNHPIVYIVLVGLFLGLCQAGLCIRSWTEYTSCLCLPWGLFPCSKNV